MCPWIYLILQTDTFIFSLPILHSGHLAILWLRNFSWNSHSVLFLSSWLHWTRNPVVLWLIATCGYSFWNFWASEWKITIHFVRPYTALLPVEEPIAMKRPVVVVITYNNTSCDDSCDIRTGIEWRFVKVFSCRQAERRPLAIKLSTLMLLWKIGNCWSHFSRYERIDWLANLEIVQFNCRRWRWYQVIQCWSKVTIVGCTHRSVSIYRPNSRFTSEIISN